jgi:hypothetical protein
MRRINNIGMIFLLLLSITGCKEFIEPSIHDKPVVLLAPSNGTEGTIYAQSFWWEEVEDALKYRLQVVTPDFNNTARLVLDTLVNTNKFNFTLDPGNYQWRVRAENGSSQTRYATATFTVYASSITTQQVQLQAPANNLLTNVSSATFKWLKLYGATKYRLEIDTNNFADEKVLFLDQTITALEYPVTFTSNKVYQWRVMALNDTASAKWSVIQNITYDNTPPVEVTLSAPATNAAVASPVTLRWAATPTAVKYQLYVYNSDQTTLYSSTYPLTLTGTTHSFTGNSGERVYWKVRAIDAAGNTGAFSELRNFTIQ